MNYFPLGLASGEAFCDREQEQKTLRRSLVSGGHTWIMAPQRIGKTSLVQ